MSKSGKRAAIVGGSIGGLTTALLLRDLGFEVDVYEKTPEELDGRGGGIVLQPEAYRWFKERSQLNPDRLSTVSRYLRYLDLSNEIVYEEPVEWRFTSWGTLYRGLLADLGRDSYHLGHCFVGMDQDADSVTLRFTNGTVATADLVVFADGISSAGRKRLLPDIKPQYSGYIGWRGTVHESALTAETIKLTGDALGYCFGDNTHICMYPIPNIDGSVDIGNRLFNYVWYRNLPDPLLLEEVMTDKMGFRGEVSIHPGKVQDRFVDEMKASVVTELAPAAAELVLRTEHPYIQKVQDVRVPNMVFGRAVLLGDSGFVARPHAAAGTAKAAAEAWALAECLEQFPNDIPAALKAWEPGQLATGNSLVDRVIIMGTRAQVENSWVPADRSLRFGLREGSLQPVY